MRRRIPEPFLRFDARVGSGQPVTFPNLRQQIIRTDRARVDFENCWFLPCSARTHGLGNYPTVAIPVNTRKSAVGRVVHGASGESLQCQCERYPVSRIAQLSRPDGVAGLASFQKPLAAESGIVRLEHVRQLFTDACQLWSWADCMTAAMAS
jgi:hypothetical protein